MTRVEKYRRYRDEISNMKFETFSQKKEAAKQINLLREKDSGDKLNYEDVMEVHEVFVSEKKIKHFKLFPLTKYEIIYTLIAIFIILIILLALIFTGKKIWG